MNTVALNGFHMSQLAGAFDSRHLELIILPTEKCNFRCTYCYETFERGAMSRAVENGVFELVRKRAKQLTNLQLSWFGGEPLLVKRAVKRMITTIDEICKTNDCALSGGFTTNGSMLELEDVAWFSKFGHANFQITLDGAKITMIALVGLPTAKDHLKRSSNCLKISLRPD